DEPYIHPKLLEECKRRLPSTLQAEGKFSALAQRQQLLRRPKSGSRGAGSRTFQTNFTQMQLRRTEIRVWRIVPIEPANTRVTKQTEAGAVRLKAVLRGVDDNGVGFANLGKCAFRPRAEVFCQNKIPAICRVRVNAESVFLAQRENVGKGIHGTSCRRPHRYH